MSLLLRIAVLWIVLGLVTGFVLRRRLGTERLAVMHALSLLPCLGHLLYVCIYTLRHSTTLGVQLVIFVGVSALLVLGGFWYTRRFLRTGPSRLSAVPFAVALLYAPPLLWFSRVLHARALGMDAIPVTVFIAATLFFTSVLTVFTAGLGRGATALERLRRRG